MKKLSTSIVFSLLSLYFFAQNYKLLPDSCTYCFSTSQNSFSGSSVGYYSVEEFWHTPTNGYSYTHCIKNQGNSIYAYFRQVGNKVYGISNNSLQDQLIMSFDENIGDTIYDLMSLESFGGETHYNAIVVDKDSLEMSDGSYHTYLYLDTDSVSHSNGFQGNGDNIVWQEKGLCYANNLPNFYAFGGGLISNLGPFTILDNTIYINPINCSTDTLIPSNFYNYGHTCDLCTPIANGINEKSKNLFKLYPNPANEIIYIESELITNQIAIYDLTGKLFESNQNLSENEIDISHLNSGVYLLEVIFNNGVSQNQKLIISR
ncbi:MAG: hypothetical protein ACI8Q1_000678 [Parvicella sp.]|jgi:hypothetical protein